MHSSSSMSKRFVLVPILAVIATQLMFLIHSVSSQNITNEYLSHRCFVKQGKYKPGSKYEEDRKSMIRSVSMMDFREGYKMMSYGKDQTYISLTLQCRGDSYGRNCLKCFDTAVAGLRRRCPRQKGGIIWYDQCFLEISAVNNHGKIDYDNIFCMSNPKKVSGDTIKFVTNWTDFVENLLLSAIKKKSPAMGSPDLYAVGETTYGTEKMYGMLQCTEEFSSNGCRECVGHSMVHFQKCLKDKRGARVVGRSCGFRFEFYPFLNKIKNGHKYMMV